MNKYFELKQALENGEQGIMRCAGNSMRPILSNPVICTYRREKTYRVGDIVFSKVNGRFIDAHKIVKVGSDGRYLIANNHGHENGWTRHVFGRVIKAVDSNGNEKNF